MPSNPGADTLSLWAPVHLCRRERRLAKEDAVHEDLRAGHVAVDVQGHGSASTPGAGQPHASKGRASARALLDAWVMLERTARRELARGCRFSAPAGWRRTVLRNVDANRFGRWRIQHRQHKNAAHEDGTSKHDGQYALIHDAAPTSTALPASPTSALLTSCNPTFLQSYFLRQAS
jgi:hypothetical protein